MRTKASGTRRTWAATDGRHFRVPETGIAPGDAAACLAGELLDGTPFEDCGPLRTL